MRRLGYVWLLGAGPGDPELLTRKAARCLEEADLALYDALVSPEVLRLAPRAQCFSVGKRCVPFEVVPGVTTAVAASALAGVPVTHRGLASGFAVVSGHDEQAYEPILRSLLPDSLGACRLMTPSARRSASHSGITCDLSELGPLRAKGMWAVAGCAGADS